MFSPWQIWWVYVGWYGRCGVELIVLFPITFPLLLLQAGRGRSQEGSAGIVLLAFCPLCVRGAGDSTALPVLRKIELVMDVFRCQTSVEGQQKAWWDTEWETTDISSVLESTRWLRAIKTMSSALLSWLHVWVESWELSVWAAVRDQSSGKRMLCCWVLFWKVGAGH